MLFTKTAASGDMKHSAGLVLSCLAFVIIILAPLDGLSTEAHRLAAVMTMLIILWTTEAMCRVDTCSISMVRGGSGGRPPRELCMRLCPSRVDLLYCLLITPSYFFACDQRSGARGFTVSCFTSRLRGTGTVDR